VDFMGFHTDDMQPQGPMVYHGSKCLGPACTAEKPITDTERLDYLGCVDPPVSIEWDGLSTWTLQVTGGIRLFQCRTLREAIDTAIRKEHK